MDARIIGEILLIDLLCLFVMTIVRDKDVKIAIRLACSARECLLEVCRALICRNDDGNERIKILRVFVKECRLFLVIGRKRIPEKLAGRCRL